MYALSHGYVFQEVVSRPEGEAGRRWVGGVGGGVGGRVRVGLRSVEFQAIIA